MKSKLQKIILLTFVLLFVAQPAFADIVFCGGRTEGETACTFSDLFTLIYVVVNYLIGMSGFVAIMYIVWGGIQMLLSGGDPGKVKDGKSTIWHAILGLMLVLVAYLIVGYVAMLLLPNTADGDPLKGLIKYIGQ